VVLVITTWFLSHTWRGLLVYFHGDDTMNMYRAWALPASRLLVSNLTPFTAEYRPLGALFYRLLYAVAGFNPLPFRIVCYCFLLFNIWLTYRFAKLLTGSTEIAVLTALIGSYHRHFMDLYQNDGTVYDILCFTFFYSALATYVNVRRTGQAFTMGQALRFLGLSVLALNSKEMAATLPVVLWAFELIYWRPPSWTSRGVLGWLGSRKYPLWITTLAVPLAVAVKRSSAGPFANNPEYTPTASLHQFFVTTKPWLAQVLFLPENALNTAMVFLVFALLLAIVIVTRQKHLGFCLVLMLVLPLPVNFIALRNFFVMYIPLVPWALTTASLLVAGREYLWKAVWHRGPLRNDVWEPERIGLFAIVALGLFSVQSRDPYRSFDQVDPTQTANQLLKSALTESCAGLRAGGKVLLRGDPFDRDVWDPLFVVRLLFHDEGIDLDRTKTAPERPPAPGRRYDCTLDFDGSRFHADRA